MYPSIEINRHREGRFLRALPREQAWDELLNPENPNTFPSPSNQGSHPPLVSHVEVTTTTRGRPQIAYAQLMQHHLLGTVNNRGSWQGFPLGGQGGQRGRLIRKNHLRCHAGLALVDPRTGNVDYRVFNPTLERIVWRGVIGQLNSSQNNPSGRQQGVANLLKRLNPRQNLRTQSASHSGPDLIDPYVLRDRCL